MAVSRLRQLHAVFQRCALNPLSSGVRFFSQTDLIQVTPRVSLFDQKVHIKVHGLPNKAKVTLHARTQQEWRKESVEFASCGHFVTNDEGVLDLNQDASTGGTYTGVNPMGPFWSLLPCPSGPQNIRMVVRNGDDPVLYTLSLHEGHLSLSDLAAKETTLTPLSSTMVTRLKKAADVRRIPVKEGGVRGVLFLPSGEGPHPGVIDMFGSAGGLMEIRAALLASHGFAVLALPFFRFDDLPGSFEHVKFDYFQEALSWFTSHKAVKDGGIGVVGVSTGAMYGMVMAWKCPEVKAVAFINGLPFLWLYDLYYKDGTLLKKGVRVDESKVHITKDGIGIKHCMMYNTDDFIPVWESSAHILMLVSEDDEQVNAELADIYYSLFPENKRHLVEFIRYPRAGHLLEPPYTPHCKACANPTFGFDLLWGGNPVDHAAAQEDSWKRIKTFLHERLS